MDAIVVIGVGREEYLKLTLPSIRAYCEKFGLALEVITEPVYNIGIHGGYNYGTFEKNQVFDYFEKYDRILRLDNDVIITPSCPNLFSLVPVEKIGVVYEDVGPKLKDRRIQIENAKRYLGRVDWWEGYFNSGVILASKCHKGVFAFNKHDIEAVQKFNLGPYKEQTFLNWLVRLDKFEIEELDFRFNHLSIFSQKWNGSPDPIDSFIAHYAGPQDTKINKIKKDLERLQQRESCSNNLGTD